MPAELKSTSRGRTMVLTLSNPEHRNALGPEMYAAGIEALSRGAGHATFVAGLVLSQATACVIEARNVLSDDFGQATSWRREAEV